MESIGDAAQLSLPHAKSRPTKPIIVIKAGPHRAAAKAAASHTGSLTGSDEVFDAAFRRSGALRVDSINGSFRYGRSPRPTAPAQGPAPLHPHQRRRSGRARHRRADSMGGELADLSPEIDGDSNKFLPGAWSHNNPIDILGDAEPERYAKALEIAAQIPRSTECWLS